MATEIDEDARTSTISPNKTFTHMLCLVHRPRGRASSIFLSSCAACSVISSVRRTIPPELHRQERASS
jgi:hypothetical protein